MRVLFLTRSEVEDLLDMRQAIACTERVFHEQAAGRVHPMAPVVAGYDGYELRVNLGALSGPGLAGLRVGMPGNALAILYDAPTGRPLCAMGYPFSTMRVGATVGLAVDRLARREARRLVVIGSGRQARAALEGVCCLRRFERIQVYSRQSKNRQAFCEHARSRVGVEVEATEEPEAAVRSADVVTVATNSTTPALRGSWLSDDVLLTTVGIRSEIDDTAYLRAGLVVVSSKEHEQDYVEVADNVLVRLTEEGRLRWEDVHELGEFMDGVTIPAGIRVFRESQGGFGDLMLMQWLYEHAREAGRGTEWDHYA